MGLVCFYLDFSASQYVRLGFWLLNQANLCICVVYIPALHTRETDKEDLDFVGVYVQPAVQRTAFNPFQNTADLAS